MLIADLAGLELGRIFYSGRLYVVETTGSTSKARPWGTPPGTTKDCVTFSAKSTLARFYPVVERALVLPILERSDFLIGNSFLGGDLFPTAYTFVTEDDAHRAAQLDCDLAVRCGLSVQHMRRQTAWLLTDGANPHRLYHYKAPGTTEAAYAVYRDSLKFVECTWPDDRTQHWRLLFG
jgi:hypothetical protein